MYILGKVISTEFPFLKFENESIGLYEKKEAGYINPRMLIKAQNTIALKNGAKILHNTVKSLRRVGTGLYEAQTNGPEGKIKL